MSRKDLEDMVVVSCYRLHLIEEGKKRVAAKTARRIAAALGTTVTTLVGRQGGGMNPAEAKKTERGTEGDEK